MQRTVKIISVLAVAALAVACGSGSSPTSPSAPGMTIPALESPKADIDVTMGLDAVYGPSANPDFVSYVRFTTAVSEKAGLGAQLNYVRGDFFQGDVLMERFDVTAAQIIEQTGSNRVEPGGERTIVVMLRFSSPADLIRATFQFTDDKGNDHHLVGNIGPSATALAAAREGESDAPEL
jgi:hypothetical protein